MKELDHLDEKILQELCKDGRQSNQDLAAKVGLSASPCWQRTKRLERDGYITGYYAALDMKKLGDLDTVLVEITLERQIFQLEDVCKEIASFPEVLEVHVTTGDFDIFVKVAVRGTAGYAKFLKERLHSIGAIRHSRSIFTLSCYKQLQSTVAR